MSVMVDNGEKWSKKQKKIKKTQNMHHGRPVHNTLREVNKHSLHAFCVDWAELLQLPKLHLRCPNHQKHQKVAK